MGRVNVFGAISNDVGQRQTVGGRRGSPGKVTAWLNSDNAQGSDCSITVSASVRGERERGGKPRRTCAGCGHKFSGSVWEVKTCPVCTVVRQGVDTRKTVFTVELPDSKWSDDSCEVEIVSAGDRLRGLLRAGALLCAIKGADEIVSGSNPAHGKQCLDFSKETVQYVEDSLTDIPEGIRLPGGVSLRHALACVQIVEAMAKEGNQIVA